MPPRVPRPVPLRMSLGYELALDADPPPRFAYWVLRRQDKEICDVAQAWVSAHIGRRLTQWEVFGILLAEALAAEDGCLAGMPLEGD